MSDLKARREHVADLIFQHHEFDNDATVERTEPWLVENDVADRVCLLRDDRRDSEVTFRVTFEPESIKVTKTEVIVTKGY